MYNLCLPVDLTRFIVPVAAIRHWDDQALVYDVVVGNNAILRHYAFYDHWFEVNCSLDPDGNFITEHFSTEPGPLDWAFNIDICTPFFSRGYRGYTVDLCLDVLVGPNGDEYVVKDEDDFAHAIENSWMTEEERVGARAGLVELLGIVRNGSLLDFLNEICAFDVRAVPQPPAEKPQVSDFAEFHIDKRLCYFGGRLCHMGRL